MEGRGDWDIYGIRADDGIEILDSDGETLNLAFEEDLPRFGVIIFTDITHVVYGFYADKRKGICECW
jgi:hypothetical protein